MSSALHRCPSCGHETEISNSLPVFAGNPSCQQCGLSASEGDVKMANDLATLFARQLEMSGVSKPATEKTLTRPNPESSPLAQPAAPPAVHSISQHYHHSTHQAPPDRHPTKPPETPGWQRWGNVSPEEMLRVHDIEPSALFPSQLTQFREATLEQRLRMIELWRVSHKIPGDISSPLTLHDRSIPAGEMECPTSHEKSQTLANASGPRSDDDMMDMDSTSNCGNAEPYVISGYQSLSQGQTEQPPMSQMQQSLSEVKESSAMAYSHSTDPVYKNHDSAHQVFEQQKSMENQYGAFQVRNMYFGCGIRTAHWLHDDEMLL